MKTNNIIAIFSLFLLVLCNSCYKHEEGCRDTNALNYDVMADVECEENCCKYPKVSLDFKMYLDTLAIDTNTYFSNNSADSLRIRMLRIYFSNFSLKDKAGAIHPLYNEVTIGTGNDSLPEYKNTIYSSIKLNEKGGVYDIGTLDKLAVYDEIDFLFGIDSLINHSAIDKIPNSSYLHQFSDSMYISRKDGYYFLKLIVDVKDKMEREINIWGDKNIQRLSLKGNIDFQRRENHTLPVKLDLGKWTNGIDFVENSDTEIQQVLMQNLNTALDIR